MCSTREAISWRSEGLYHHDCMSHCAHVPMHLLLSQKADNTIEVLGHFCEEYLQPCEGFWCWLWNALLLVLTLQCTSSAPRLSMQELELAGLVGGLLLSLVWMLVLRYSAGLLAWLVVLIVNVLFVACTLLAFTKVRSRPSGRSPGSH